jgi:hypothetical protein
MFLLDVPGEMTERVLPAIAEADSPSSRATGASEDSSQSDSVTGGDSTTTAERAKHGRALSGGHSTLAVGAAIRGNKNQRSQGDRQKRQANYLHPSLLRSMSKYMASRPALQ